MDTPSLTFFTEDETTYTSKSNEDVSKEENFSQLSPAFCHTPPRTVQNIYPVEFYSAKTSMNPLQLGVSSPYRIDRTIIFGVEPESNQSSPISVPSASSTAFTQPTPLSDNNSYRSQSLYQGYGHVPNLYEQYAPPKLLFVPPAEPSSYPAYTAAESEYSALLPQTSTTLGPSLSQVLEPDLYSHNRDSLSVLGAYLKHQFDSASFADCVLELKIRGLKTEVMLHSVLIAQNPTCRALLEADMIPKREGRKVINFDSSDQYLTAPIILSCLRYYYGEQLPTRTATTDGLESAMSYLSAGRLLRIPEVEDFGTTAVLRYLTLENLETALRYVLQPNDDMTAEKELVRQASGNAVEGADVNIDFSTDKLTQGLVEFIAGNFPYPFVLDVQAPPSTQLGGYPAIPDPDQGQKISKPELLSIRFGDFPSASYLMPTAEATKMSSILLALPVSVLRAILAALEQPVRDDISVPIMEERERRRLKAQ